jgi:hypothetical protein
MIVTSKCAIKHFGTCNWFFQLFAYLSPLFFFQRLTLYFLYDNSYNSSHVRTNSIDLSSIYEDKNRQNSLLSNTRSVVELTTRVLPSRNRAGRTRAVMSNILAQQRRRNGTETWRRRSCQCEHLLHTRKLYWTVTFRDGTETRLSESV